MSQKAKRYNKGKVRYELISTIALQELAKVYTLGAHKYSVYNDDSGKVVFGKDIPFEEVGNYKLIEDASSNWKLGLNWKEAMGSVKRHIEAWESGEDFDELGTLHLGNAMWGLATLIDFYKTYPQGDDRPHNYLKEVKIGLDIDEVICDWTGAWCEKFGYEIPKNWNFSYDNKEHFESFTKEELNEFYLNIPPKIKAEDLPFEPHCYITSRSVPEELTKKWLMKHGFPTTPVYSIGFGVSKVEVALKSGIDLFVDDRFENFVELNNNGICCFLFDAPHNQRYNVGFKRIKTLNELVQKY